MAGTKENQICKSEGQKGEYLCKDIFICHYILFGSLNVCFIYVYSRNPSVNESYEFDATECRIGLGLLEAMKMEQSGVGLGRELRYDRPFTSTGLQDLEKGEKEKGPIKNLPIEMYLCISEKNVTTALLLTYFFLLHILSTLGPNVFVSFRSVSQPSRQQSSHSVSETRFNALMQEFQEYKRIQESQDLYLHPNLNSNSESALL